MTTDTTDTTNILNNTPVEQMSQGDLIEYLLGKELSDEKRNAAVNIKISELQKLAKEKRDKEK